MENYFKAFQVLSDAEIANIIQVSSKRDLKKGGYFVREGECCKEVAFIVSGTLRSYYISEQGEEITYCITFPNNMMTAYTSFITGNPSEENIQAITPVELRVLSKPDIENMAKKNPNIVSFLRKIAEYQYMELEKRIFQFQKVNASQRYVDLIKNQPQYMQEIPLSFIASYLGVTQRHLSRIRKELLLGQMSARP